MNINGRSSCRANHVLAGKTARPCDSCLVKRARWFCAADDAFLCQSCDAAVHSANQLASRHQRVRLETAATSYNSKAPAWHQGFTKKPRTPRQPKSRHNHVQLPLVPEMGSEDQPSFLEENEEDDHLLFCRVPVFDPFEEGSMAFDGDLNLDELLSSCDDEFAADVESLLGNDKDDGILFMMDDEKRSSSSVVKLTKVEEKDDDDDEETAACHLDDPVELMSCRELNSNNMNSSEDRKIDDDGEMGLMNHEESSSSTLLRLNYEAVIAAWAAREGNSPWADGIRPHFNLHHHDFINMGAWLLGGMKGRIDAGREARVSRYREKRRTRLFSKKIRYEVRKLNAEKRPRMKGRFVKRTTTPFSSPNYLHRIK